MHREKMFLYGMLISPICPSSNSASSANVRLLSSQLAYPRKGLQGNEMNGMESVLKYRSSADARLVIVACMRMSNAGNPISGVPSSNDQLPLYAEESL